MTKYDVIVAGGGFAGAAAAISAARGVAKVLIIDKGNSFGGAAANCLVNPYMLYWTISPETKQKKILAAGIFSEINAELAKFNATKPVNDTDLGFHEEYLKLVLNRIDEAAARRYISFLFLTKKITEYEEKNLLGILKEIINCNECYKLSGLNVKGEDILKLGFEPKEVGKILNKLLNKVIEDNSLNEKNTLLDFAKNM